ncbi:2Fe-2S iron-sulfur cluster-binding protein [Kitasatospora sp. GAS206B]|uniref:(2Fe-2S)-binding protein n=1 Tax=unclassified Kitasatospora TaxID=2633591 RepID=UPI003513AB06
MAHEPTNHPVHLGDGRPTTSYTLRVNGFERPVTDAWIGESLLYVLRERLGLAGAKNGCEQGECGACSVQVDGQLVAGCLVPAALAADSEISTVEGLSAGGAASDVQQALAESGAVQCGYCTPGMAMAVHDLLQRNHRPSEVEARQALCGNLCRCTGYRSVLAAVQTVADARGAALLEAEQAGADAQSEQPQPAAPAAGADAGDRAEPGRAAEPLDPPVYQDAWAGTATAGEVPLFGADSGWISADPMPATAEYPSGHSGEQPTAAGTGLGAMPAQGYAGYDPTAYGPGTVYDGGVNYEPTPAHGTAAPGAPYEGTPAHGTPYEPTPAHGVPYDATPAHGTDYPAAPPYAAGPYAAAPYPGTAYDGVAYQGTPAHGIPAPATPFDGTVYETAPGMPEAGTPAHGLRLPEDDHA